MTVDGRGGPPLNQSAWVVKSWRAVILAVAMLALHPDRAVAAGMDDTVIAPGLSR